MLHKGYNRMDSVAKKISGGEPQGAWRQDERIGGKPPVTLILILTLIMSELWDSRQPVRT
jgi:hypothetical protein